MLRLSMVILFCCAITGGVVAQSTQKYNLDFEQLDAKGNAKGWRLGLSDKTNIFTIDSTVKQHGKYALKIDWKNSYGQRGLFTEIKDAFKGKKITLTGYIKTEDLVGEGAALWMRLDDDDKTLAYNDMDGRRVNGTTDWQPYSITMDYDGQAVSKIVFGAVIKGEGKMWIDNLSLSIDGVDISKATPLLKKVYKASLDTAYQRGSGINSIPLNDEKIKELTNLGMLWGFIKYYHANVSKGDYNMDAELFRILPKIIAAKDQKEANALMEQWTDGFGKPAICSSCKDFVKTAQTIQAPDYGYLFAENNFPKTLMDKLAYIKHNVDTGNDHYYIGFTKGPGNPVFRHEKIYWQTPYPDAGTRLLALYRYWNMVQYFFPDKHLIGEDWNKVLETSIPEFINAKDTSAYVMACLHLIAHIHDTHGGIWDPRNLSYIKGSLMTPFMAKFIENKLVVTGYYKDTLNIKRKVRIGDVIEKIDGTPVDELVKKYLPATPASNYETQLRDMPGTSGFLLTSNDPTVRLQINRDGKLADITVPRIKGDWDMVVMDVRPAANNIAYKLLPGNIGYIYPGNLEEGDLAKIKHSLGKTRGLIIDMRCYPNTFMPYTYGEWLKPESSPFVRLTKTTAQLPGDFELFAEVGENGTKNKDNYKGKLVIIVNAQTQSLGEFTTMALSTVPGAVVIGSTTAGADGDMSAITLPGGVTTNFSGIGILYPDGTESQRKGVKIDKVVTPTIEGIKEGRDELLEAAIKIIKS